MKVDQFAQFSNRGTKKVGRGRRVWKPAAPKVFNKLFPISGFSPAAHSVIRSGMDPKTIPSSNGLGILYIVFS